MQRDHKKIATTLTIWLVIPIALGFGIFVIIDAIRETNHARQQAERECEDWAVTVATGLQQVLLAAPDAPLKSATDLIRSQQAATPMMTLQLLDKTGQEIVTESVVPLAVMPVNLSHFTHAFTTGDPVSYYENNDRWLTHLKSVQQPPAVLRVTMSMDEEFRRIRQRAYTTVSIGLLMMACVAFLLRLSIKRLVVRPLQRVVDTVEAIGGGQMAMRVPALPDNEIGILGKHVNRMADQRQAAEAEQQRLLHKQRDLEMELFQQAKLSAIGALAQGLAHNLRSPLTIIKGYADILRISHPGKDTEELNYISAESDRMNDMIENIMIKSRREQEVNCVSINLNELLHEEFQFLEADITFKHNIEKEYRFADALPSFAGVYSDFSQSLMNLVRNAIDAMHDRPEKRLTVTTRYDEDAIYVDISDTGHGISEKNLSKIFEPFFTTKPMAGRQRPGEPFGTGLGLSSCLQLIQPYGAKIDVQSREGVGTTFTVRIPRGEIHPCAVHADYIKGM